MIDSHHKAIIEILFCCSNVMDGTITGFQRDIECVRTFLNSRCYETDSGGL